MTYRVKNVALGQSGLAGIAAPNMTDPRDLLKLSPSLRALTTLYSVRFRPSLGRKPWLAKVFIIGHGPRTITGQSVYCEGKVEVQHTVSRCRCDPNTLVGGGDILPLVKSGRDQAKDQAGRKNVELHIDLLIVTVVLYNSSSLKRVNCGLFFPSSRLGYLWLTAFGIFFIHPKFPV